MAKRKLLAGVLTSALFLGCLAPAGMVMAAETEVETVLNLEKEAQTVSEDAEVKADGVEDENGFVIDENGVLTDYKGSGCSKLGKITIKSTTLKNVEKNALKGNKSNAKYIL